MFYLLVSLFGLLVLVTGSHVAQAGLKYHVAMVGLQLLPSCLSLTNTVLWMFSTIMSIECF